MQWYRIGVNKIRLTVCDVFTSRSVLLRNVFRKRSVAKVSWQDKGDCRLDVLSDVGSEHGVDIVDSLSWDESDPESKEV